MNWKQIVGMAFCAFILWHKIYPPGSYSPKFEFGNPREVVSYTWEPMFTYKNLDGCYNREQMDLRSRKGRWEILTAEDRATMPNVISVCFPGLPG